RHDPIQRPRFRSWDRIGQVHYYHRRGRRRWVVRGQDKHNNGDARREHDDEEHSSSFDITCHACGGSNATKAKNTTPHLTRSCAVISNRKVLESFKSLFRPSFVFIRAIPGSPLHSSHSMVLSLHDSVLLNEHQASGLAENT